MKCFLPNLTFEDELQNPDRRPTPATQRTLAELAPLMGLMAAEDDVVLLREQPMTSDLPECLQHVRFRSVDDAVSAECVPWGWTRGARLIAERLGMAEPVIPNHDSVVMVNSRSFAAQYDRVVGDELEATLFASHTFGRVCGQLDECRMAVDEFHEAGFSRWVAKPQISHAGRNRLLMTGGCLNDQQTGWLVKHLQQIGGVYLEPWVHVQEECGLQFEISSPVNGSEIRLVGVTQLLNDRSGRYLGSGIRNDTFLEDHWANAVRHGITVCQAARDAGYFGPLGIDAFRFELANGRSAVRLCNDINARFTMGRLALRLRHLLQPGEIGLWGQVVVADSSQLAALMPKLPAKLAFSDVRIVATSPHRIADQPVRLRTVLLAGPSDQRLAEVLELLRSPST